MREFKVKTFWIGLILTALLASLGAQAEVFRWTDKSGKVHYSDAPPPEADAQTRRLYDSRIEQDKLPYETSRAAEKFPLTLYVSEDCKEHCGSARAWLQKRKAPFSEKLVKTNEEGDALKQLTGNKQVFLPTLTVGSKVIEGFEAGAWGSALDLAGYPK